MKPYRHNEVAPVVAGVADLAWVVGREWVVADPAWVAARAAAPVADPAWVAPLPVGSIELVRLAVAVSLTGEAVPPVDLVDPVADPDLSVLRLAALADPFHQDLAVDLARTGIVGVPLLPVGGWAR